LTNDQKGANFLYYLEKVVGGLEVFSRGFLYNFRGVQDTDAAPEC